MALSEMPKSVSTSFHKFVKDDSTFALSVLRTPSGFESGQRVLYPKNSASNFKAALNSLQSLLDLKTPLYLFVRRDGKLISITYVPHRADDTLKELYIASRRSLVRTLGEEHFSTSLICKEPAEIYDYRSWEERDSKNEACEECNDGSCERNSVKDLGYQKNKCRLCDQRMKNPISEDARNALRNLQTAGACVQLSLNLPTLTLRLAFSSILQPDTLASKLPTDLPSYTFYRHPITSLLYFIYLSPDSAPVKARMSSTMAIPGLVNIIADNEEGVTVDRKIEIHDPEELDLEGVSAEGRDGRIGKFRSLYLRNEFEGTESMWEGMEKV